MVISVMTFAFLDTYYNAIMHEFTFVLKSTFKFGMLLHNLAEERVPFSSSENTFNHLFFFLITGGPL